jgi:hypothetical protein
MSKAMRSLFWLSVLAALLTTGPGCASSKGKSTTLDTPSGQPEITVQSPQLDPILSAARDFFLGRGYIEAPSRHAYELVFDRRIESSKKPQALRIRLRAVRNDAASWRVAGISLKVEDWRGDLASEMVVPYGFPQVQEFLEAIKMQVELAKP